MICPDNCYLMMHITLPVSSYSSFVWYARTTANIVGKCDAAGYFLILRHLPEADEMILYNIFLKVFSLILLSYRYRERRGYEVFTKHACVISAFNDNEGHFVLNKSDLMLQINIEMSQE